MRSKHIWITTLVLLFAIHSSALAQGVWVTNSPIPVSFGREGSCIAGSSAPDKFGVAAFRIYIINGFGCPGDTTTNTAYDPATDAYTLGLAPIPGPPRSEGAGVERSGFIYCLGGRAGVTLPFNHRYDPSTDTWAVLPPMPVPVAAEYSAVVVGAEIHVIGGRTGGATVPFSAPKTSAHQVFHVGKGIWGFAAPLPGPPRSEMAAVAHGNKIYVMGGNVVLFGASVPTVDIYDVSKDVWAPGPPMPLPLANAAAAVLGNSIYVTGGKLLGFGGPFSPFTLRFDIDTGVWALDTPKPTPTAETAGISHGGQMFVIGGGFFGAACPVLGSINESFRPTPP